MERVAPGMAGVQGKDHKASSDLMKKYRTEKRIRRIAAVLAAAAVLFLCEPVSAFAMTGAFPDVPASHPAYLYVQACSRAGIMNGLEDGSFGPNEALTAEQLSVMIMRACFPAEIGRNENGGLWSRPYTDAAEKLGLLAGIGRYMPQGKPDVDETEDDAEAGGIYEPAAADPLKAPLRRCDAALMASRADVMLRGERCDVIRFDETALPGYSLSRCGQPIGYCLSSGLMRAWSDGLFHGDDILTRAQGAELIARLARLSLRAADLSAYEPPKRENTRLLVLMYHRVLPDGSECGDWDATESSFREDLQWLADSGFKTVLPSDLAEGRALPERAVMLTFDDGYEDNYRQAFPLLKEYNAKAVIAPVVSWLDEGRAGFLSWNMLREMCASGLVEPGSHTYQLHGGGDGGSRGISRGDETQEGYVKRLKEDLELSVSRIESETGVRPCYFAYPFGLTDSWANGVIDYFFRVSAVTKVGVPDISRGTERLTRYNVNSEYGARYYAVRSYL